MKRFLLIFAIAVARVYADEPAQTVKSAVGAAGALVDTSQKTKPLTGGTTQQAGLPNEKDMTPFQKETMSKAPSFQLKKWTGKQASYETNVEYDYIGGANQNIGVGPDQKVSETYLDIHHEFMRHTLLAFLIEGGAEYQHMGFDRPNGSFVPNRLDMLYLDVGIDFRWSEKDLLHIQGRPGFYTEFDGNTFDAVNTPLEIGYTRVVSDSLQWVVGFSLNTWRASRYLGAAGVRWQINERWKIKAYLPTPDIEYYARPDLTLMVGADLRGESYRVGPHFGDSVGQPSLNNALVDYQEVRVGPGFSWNVRPLIEINFMAGYMVGRQFDFHNNNGLTLNSAGTPFVSIGVHALFKMSGEPLDVPQRNTISIHNIFTYL